MSPHLPPDKLLPRDVLRTTYYVLRTLFALTLCGFVAVVLALVSPTALSQSSFADPAFKGLWDRTDGLVASGAAKRPWVWGPAPAASLSEPFGGIPGNSHLVQYFDK